MFKKILMANRGDKRLCRAATATQSTKKCVARAACTGDEATEMKHV